MLGERGPMRTVAAVLMFTACFPVVAAAQQRPLLTEDPEPIGAGRLLIEGGFDYSVDAQFPVSGLQGNLWRVPRVGVSIGISSIAEFQVDGGFYNHLSITDRKDAPLSDLLQIEGDSTSDFEDFVVGTKIRVMAESPRHPSFALRFATKLPNATNENGIGLDTMDFFATLLAAKTVQSVRIVGNAGLGVLTSPTSIDEQNDVLHVRRVVCSRTDRQSRVRW